MSLRRLDQGQQVAQLQRDLGRLRFDLVVDGDFGPKTEWAVKLYQASCGLVADGVVGELTGAAIVADLAARHVPDLIAFRGRVGFLAVIEGHRGRPYWPGEHDPEAGRYSGLTLDPGFDLGHQTKARLCALYGRVFTEAQLVGLEQALGLRGEAAWEVGQRLREMHISRERAADILPSIAGPYWREVLRACPGITHPSAPPGAHTAVLSLCYNAGADDLRPLRPSIGRHDWQGLAQAIGSIPKLPERRKLEASLI